jgi:tryptophan synthase alpha chain
VTVHNAIDDAFQRAREQGRAALMPYLTAGFPRPESYVEVAVATLEAGADMLEIGVPFSDPLLDGPAVQHSQSAALEHGVTPASCLEFARAIKARTNAPLLLMGAYNPMVAFGLEPFCEAAGKAGVNGLIVPDLPLEEQRELREVAQRNNLHLIQLVAPTSPPQRVANVCAVASGFVYCISVAGVTGARTGVAELARPLVERIRSCTAVPIAVGFGIAGPREAQSVGQFADGAIVGSALVTLVGEAGANAPAAAHTFVSSLRSALEMSRQG